MALPEDYDGPTFELDGERYPFKPTDLMGSQVKVMQSRTGLNFMQYIEAMETLDAEAVGFYIWYALEKAGKAPGKYSEFDYSYTGFLESLEGLPKKGEGDEVDPTPPPNRAARRKAPSKKNSGNTARSSRSTVTSPPTGS